MARFLVLLLLVIALAACAGASEDTAEARIVSAQVVHSGVPALEAQLALRLSPTMLQALERGIPLTLKFSLRARGEITRLDSERRLRVSYAPLAQQYQVEDLEFGATRNFARRALLLAWFDRVHLPLDDVWQGLPAGAHCSLTLELDTSALPGPLRLPALVATDWRLSAGTFAWTAGA